MHVRVDSYVGTGSSLSITGLGFQPDMVLIKGGANIGAIRISSMTGDNTKPVTGATAFFSGGVTSLDADGFSLGTDARVNANGTTYYYVALGDPTSDIFTGTYTGNGSAGHGITGVGFAPNAVLIMDNSANNLTMRTSASGADGQSWSSQETASLITALGADGFTVGSRVTAPTANVNSTTYYYICLKDAAGAFYGSLGYAGNAANPRTITGVGFAPELAMVKRRTSSNEMVGKHVDESGANCLRYDGNTELTTVITALAADGFTCTADARVNANSPDNYLVLAFLSFPTVWPLDADITGDGDINADLNQGFAVSADISGTGTISASESRGWALAADVLGTSSIASERMHGSFSLAANILGRSGGYAHAEQTGAAGTPNDPYGGLST